MFSADNSCYTLHAHLIWHSSVASCMPSHQACRGVHTAFQTLPFGKGPPTPHNPEGLKPREKLWTPANIMQKHSDSPLLQVAEGCFSCKHFW